MTEHPSPDEFRERWNQMKEPAHAIFNEAIDAYEEEQRVHGMNIQAAKHYREKYEAALEENQRLREAAQRAADKWRDDEWDYPGWEEHPDAAPLVELFDVLDGDEA